MSREDRPSIVKCSGPCGQKVAARDAREALLVWAMTASGEGTMTHPVAPIRVNVWCCKRCLDQRVDLRTNFPPELREVATRLAALAGRTLQFLIPQQVWSLLAPKTERQKLSDIVKRRETA